MKRKLAILSLLIICSFQLVSAQGWKELNPPPSIFNGMVNKVVTDAAGNVYAAGDFKNANNEWVVVKWNGSYWSELGQGANALKANNGITSLVADANGNIYAAGAFSNNTGRIYVAKWDGFSWSQLGSLTFNAFIYALAIDNSGNIYAGGSFTNTSGKKYIAKWNGLAWTEMGTGTNGLNTNDLIYAIAADHSGKVYAAGYLTNANNRQYVAAWNGTNWTELGGTTLNANGYITGLFADNNGNVFASGDFANASGNKYVAQWNGSSWSELGAINANGTIKTIYKQGANLYVSGQFTDPSGFYYVAKWDGANWSTAFRIPNSNAGTTIVNTVHVDNAGNIYAGGSFTNTSGYRDVVKWNGSAVINLGRKGTNLKSVNGIYQLIHDNNGNVYTVIDDPNVGRVAFKWNGVGWNEMGSGESVEYITVDPSGTVYGTGMFRSLNNRRVAKWNGAAWVPVENPNQPLTVTAVGPMISDQAGNIYWAGRFGPNNVSIVKWDGTNWTEFNPNFIWNVTKMVIDGNGTIYSIGGYFVSGRFYVMKITPTDYGEVRSPSSFLNTITGLIWDIAVDNSGNLYAGGSFDNANHNGYVAKWDGTTWSELQGLDQYGTDFISAMTSSKNKVFATGRFGQSTSNFVARWEGTAWTKLLPEQFFNSEIRIMNSDSLETVYVDWGASSTNYRAVLAHGKSVKLLQQPNLTLLQTSYCQSAAPVLVKLSNLPDGIRVNYAASLDANSLTVAADSTIRLNFSALAPGQHSLKIMYSIGTDTMDYVQNFTVSAAAAPDVNLSTPISTIVNLNPFTITATNAAGGGVAPLYTFAKDKNFTNILQAESATATVVINPNTLAQGFNRIFVRMKTSEACFVSQTAIDSIDITVSVVTGVIDPSNPGTALTVYPVPVQNFLVLKGLVSSKTYTIKIFNSLGIELHRQSIRNVTEKMISDPVSKPGSYWLSVYDETKKRYLGAIPFVK